MTQSPVCPLQSSNTVRENICEHVWYPVAILEIQKEQNKA